MFSRPQEQEPETESESGSETSSTSRNAPPLPPEAQRILASIPDSIASETGAEGDDPGGTDDAELVVVPEFSFKEADIQDGIASLFDWMGDHVGEHCGLSERQLSFVTGPTTQVLNASIGGLSGWMPGFLQRWCESTPGAAAFLFAWGVVLTPMGIAHVSRMREKRREIKERVPRMEQVPAQPRPQPVPKQPGVPRVNWEPQQ